VCFFFFFFGTYNGLSIFNHCTGTVPIYDGRKRQLKVPDELRNVPGILPHYLGQIPNHSLVLVAYAVSQYRAAQGSRKGQPTVPLSISFAVVLYDKPLDIKGSDSGEDQKDGDPAEEHDGKATDNQSDEAPQDQSDERVQDQSAEEAENPVSAEEGEDQSEAEAEELSDASAEEESDDD